MMATPNRPACPRRAIRLSLILTLLLLPEPTAVMAAAAPDDAAATAWPQFRGPNASGVAGGDHRTPTTWDIAAGKNVLWKGPVPGLGLSSPVVWGDRVFVTTAVSEKEVAAGEKANEELRVGLYGSITSVPDEGVLLWKVLCFDRATGKPLWEHTAHRGRPQVRRHPKSSHANPTPATDGKRLVVFFGTEGLHCYDLDGKPLWTKDFGLLDSGFFTVPAAQWGFASSPVLHEGKVVLQVDVQKKQNKSFVGVFNAADGAPVWSTPRGDVPTWSTPAVVRDEKTGKTQVVCNGFEESAGYDFETGKKLWKIGGGGDIPVPTPVHSAKHGLVYLASAHGPSSPLIALRTTAEGELKPPKDKEPADHVAWSVRRAGVYMQTPLVLGDLLYACRDNGVLACFDAATGKEHFRQRLEAGAKGFTASPVAADGKLYFTGESGDVVVLKAADKFEQLATNTLGEPALATPAVSRGVIFFRTRSHLVAVGEAKEK